MEFRWNDWNTEHVADHGVDPDEAEEIIRRARTPYPQKREDEKWLVWGQTNGGRFLQVVFLLDENDTMYVIHARPLTEKEKHRLRRRRKS